MSTATFGARLRAARAVRGLPQAALAQQTGFPLAVVGAWEEDAIAPDQEMVRQLAALLAVRRHWLASGEGEMEAE